jgi:hypothetical protein
MKRAKKTTIAPIKLDIGCGPNKKAGFVGMDAIAFPGVDHVCDIRKRWPFKDGSVSEAHCSHVIEHLTNFHGQWERVHFFNELYRVLAKGASCQLVFPHWASNRYYGDPTHKEPFSEMGFYYLSQEWRTTQAPHTDRAHNPDGYVCDFEATWGYSLHQGLVSRNTEYQQHALAYWKEAAQDIMATLTKR